MSDVKIRPYTGEKNYIFISYSHKDTERVMPILRYMAEIGYRIWYDEGIDPGTEWDEIIAAHIDACGYFVALISQNYLNSSNCKDELHYARDTEKKRLLVYLENIELPSGMRMRLSRLQNIHKYAYSKEEEFYDKLFTADGINECKEEAVPQNVLAEEPVVVVPEEPENAEDVETEVAVAVEVEETEAVEENSEPEEPEVNWAEVFEYVTDDEEIVIIGLNDEYIYLEKIIIPEIIEGKPVTVIDDFAFSDWYGIKEVILPDCIKKIGEYAFDCCESLASITLPDGLEEVGDYAFGSCDNLPVLKLPSSVVRVGEDIHKNVVWADGVEVAVAVEVEETEAVEINNDQEETEINWAEAFEYETDGEKVTVTGLKDEHRDLEKVVIPEMIEGKPVTAIGEDAFAFSGCGAIKEVILPDSIKEIGAFAFYNCKSLSNIILPENLREIGAFAFCDCKSLSNIILLENLRKIGSRAFYACDLKSITIPKNVKVLQESVFMHCKELSEVIVLGKLSEIGKSAFEGCCSLKDIGFAKDVPIIGSRAFLGCGVWDDMELEGIENFYYTEIMFDKIRIDGLKKKTISELSIPKFIGEKEVTEIGYRAFSGCYEMKEVELPDSIKNIGEAAFEGCYSLTSITLPDGLEEIGDEAFSCCFDLPVLELPASVIRVGMNIHTNVVRKKTAVELVANECAGRSSGFRPQGPSNKIIDKTEGVDWDKIFEYKIEDNEITITRLKDRTLIHLTFPSTINGYPVKRINLRLPCGTMESIKFSEGIERVTGDFYGWSKLKYIEFSGGLVHFNLAAFKYTPWWEEQKKISPLVVVNGKLLAADEVEGEVILPKEITSLSSEVFKGNKKLTGIELPDGIRLIPFYMFEGCSNLTTVTLPDTVNMICPGAFKDCISLECINIPAAASVMKSAFEGCTKLKNRT